PHHRRDQGDLRQCDQPEALWAAAGGLSGMSRVIAFLVGLAIVGGGIFAVVYKNKGSHPELKGSILKVRSLADGDGAIVFLDFRVTNTAAIPFVVNSVQMTMETLDSEVANAVMFSKSDVDKVTRYLKLLGP